MDQVDWLTEQFEANRPRLHAVAYRMLGSHAEAEDAVQEAWLRLNRADRAGVENLGGWLTTVTARVCLDSLRSRRSRREEPASERPLDASIGAAHEDDDPAHQAVMGDSVGSALLVVLDQLAPAERVAFVLHDVFGVPFDEIGDIVGRTPEAARQLASRARRRVRGTDASPVDPVRQRQVVNAFLAAARSGDFEGLVALLDPDVVLRPDAAALRMGSLPVTRGATEVATALAGGARSARVALIDGMAGLVWAPGGRTRSVIGFTIVDGNIVEINVTGDPEQIELLDIVLVRD